MKRKLGYLLVVVAAVALVSCSAQEPAEQPVEVVAVEEAAAGQITVIDLEIVEVTAEGTVFEVPVQIEQIPEGAWFCDMGTAHYAQLEEGEGTCPTCGMKLVHKVAVVEERVDGTEEEATQES